MKRPPSVCTQRYVAIVSIFLIVLVALVLIAGMVGCAQPEPELELECTPMVALGRLAHYTVGLKDDGTMVAVGLNYHGECNVGGWTRIEQVAAGFYHTVGLKKDHTVVAAGLEVELTKWNLIEAAP